MAGEIIVTASPNSIGDTGSVAPAGGGAGAQAQAILSSYLNTFNAVSHLEIEDDVTPEIIVVANRLKNEIHSHK